MGSRSSVFVSYSSRDSRFVKREIVKTLEAHGIKTWIADRDILAGESFEDAILRGLNSTERVLVVLSPRSIASEWVKSEVAWAVRERWPNRIVPVLLEKCDAGKLHFWLPRLQYVDFTHGVNVACAKLLAVWNKSPNGIHKRANTPRTHVTARHRSRRWKCA